MVSLLPPTLLLCPSSTAIDQRMCRQTSSKPSATILELTRTSGKTDLEESSSTQIGLAAEGKSQLPRTTPDAGYFLAGTF